MNRRQKKKAFKKKYGMNPKQYERYMQLRAIEYIISPEFQERLDEMVEKITESLTRMADMVAAGLSEWMKNITEAFEKAQYNQETEQMLKEAYILPEGSEKELLKDAGIRTDQHGTMWRFYEDEANNVIFVENLGKGDGCSGCSVDDFEDDRHGMRNSACPDCADHSDCLHGSSGEEPD